MKNTEYQKRGGRTLGVHDRLVAGIFGNLELLDQSEHLCAWFHIVVTSAPGGDSALTGFLALFIRDGCLSFWLDEGALRSSQASLCRSRCHHRSYLRRVPRADEVSPASIKHRVSFIFIIANQQKKSSLLSLIDPKSV
jgi:hypothetical protein